MGRPEQSSTYQSLHTRNAGPAQGLACSESGVLNTRALPNRVSRPAVHLKTPPKATSSPNTRALQFRELFSGSCPVVNASAGPSGLISATAKHCHPPGSTYFGSVSKAIANASFTAWHRLISGSGLATSTCMAKCLATMQGHECCLCLLKAIPAWPSILPDHGCQGNPRDCMMIILMIETAGTCC